MHLQPKTILGVGTLLLATFAGCTSSQEAPAVSGPAATVLHLEKAALNSRGVHVVDIAVVGPSTSTLVGTFGRHHARVSVTNSISGEAMTIWRSPTVVMITGSPASLAGALSISLARATAVANTWISVSPADGPYQRLVNATSLQGELQPFLPVTRLHRATTPLTWVLSGRPDPQLGAGTVSVIVARATSLPTKATLTLSSHGSTLRRTVVFTSWGTPFGGPLTQPHRTFASLTAN